MTHQLPYTYETGAEWVGSRVVTATASGLPEVPIAPPPEFGGEGGYWTPEHLYVASANTCFAVTFLAIAGLSKLEFVSFETYATGKLEKVEGSGLQITEIVLKPTLVVTRTGDLERALRILEKAEKACLISNSMKTTILLEPDVRVEMPEKLVA